MTADSSNAAITKSGDGDGVNSPSGRLTLPSPWAQVVRGGIQQDSVSRSPRSGSTERNFISSDPVTAVDPPSPAVHARSVEVDARSPAIEALSPAVEALLPAVDVSPPAETQPEGSDGGNVCNAGGVVKSAWNKPSANGVVEGNTSPVMGAALWPALSESTGSGAKLLPVPSESSSKAVSQAPVTVQPPPKPMKPNSNFHSNSNHIRQRPMRRGGSVGGASVGPPPFPLVDMFGNLVPAVPEFSQPPFKNNNWSPRSNDRTWNRNPARRNNSGPRPFSFGYGGRRYHHGPRTSAARDVHIPHQMGPPPTPPLRGFVPPPFIPHQQPYGAPMGYEMGASYVYIPTIAQEPYRGGAPHVPHGASGSSMFIPYWDPLLHDSILKQIEYYFSDDNLVKDNFLRSHMDDEGWVPITLIAGFQRVQNLTNDMQMILNSLLYSNTVEIQGDKVRRRTDWRRWIHIPCKTTIEEASLQKLTLEDGPTDVKEVLANGDNSREDPCS